jgi:hypothetical protein
MTGLDALLRPRVVLAFACVGVLLIGLCAGSDNTVEPQTTSGADSKTAQFDPNLPYRFPVLPGSAEWKSLPDDDARIRATELPQGLAAKLSTKALLTTCLNYPSLGHMGFASGSDRQLAMVSDRFSGCRELLTRQDLAEPLVEANVSFELTKIVPPAGLKPVDLDKQGFLTVLLCEKKIQQSLTAEQGRAVLAKALETVLAMRRRFGPSAAENDSAGLALDLLYRGSLRLQRDGRTLDFPLDGNSGPDVAYNYAVRALN